jgi:hypothetical protein
MKWLFALGRRDPDRQSRIGALADQAVIAWKTGAPSDERLTIFLSTLEARLRKRVERLARKAVSDFDRLVAIGPGGISLDEHLAGMRPKLEAKHPWLSDQAYDRLSFYAYWMNWHG